MQGLTWNEEEVKGKTRMNMITEVCTIEKKGDNKAKKKKNNERKMKKVQ
jgi:hypothetical protein